MHAEVAQELEPVRVGVGHGELHATEGDLVDAHGFVAADDVAHVVRHERQGDVRIVAGQREPVAAVELHVLVTQRAFRQVVQGRSRVASS